jgi:hypothetical protein
MATQIDWTYGFETNCRHDSRGASCPWISKSQTPAVACWDELGGAGRGLGAMDAVIAAICLASYLALATRNTGDFDGLGLELFAP